MNRFQKIAARLLGLKSKTYDTRSHEFASLFSAPSYTGKAVNENTAMQVSVAWACVRILAETIGSLPLAFYERDAKGNAVKVDYDQLSEVLIAMPNADMTSVEYREAKTTNLALRGNCYSLVDRSGSAGRVSSLYPLLSQNVTPKRRDDGTIYYEVREAGGKVETYPREKIWHVKGFGANGLEGYSPIAHARQALGMGLATEEFQARFFANGANPSWLITIPEWLDDAQREIAKKNVREIWQGLDNAHRAAILEGGMTATAATMPLQDAQFLELRGFTVQEVCRFYRIPPHMVMDLSRSTNNNIEHQGQEFVMFTLAPYLTRFEASMSRWLIPAKDRARIFARFNVEGLLRADAAGRAALYASGLQNGWLSRNEVRALENRNAASEAGMESFTAQSNLLPVEALFDDTRRNAAAAKPAPTASPEKALSTTTTNNVSLELPAELKHHLTQSVEVPGVLEVAVEARRANDHAAAAAQAVQQQVGALMKAVGALQAKLAQQDDAVAAVAEGVTALIDYSKADRVLVIDEDGMPVRSKLDIN